MVLDEWKQECGDYCRHGYSGQRKRESRKILGFGWGNTKTVDGSTKVIPIVTGSLSTIASRVDSFLIETNVTESCLNSEMSSIEKTRIVRKVLII